jgi:lipoate-protein ligase A
MQFLDRTLPTPEENLALDEALLLQAEAGQGGETLRLWEWPRPAVVLGCGCRLIEDVDEAACQAEGVPILRRSSGGGSVLLGFGCLCYSLVLAYDRSPLLQEIRPSYRYILGRVSEALHDVLPDVEPAGISDVAAGGRKFSGNAQQRKRNFLLHHGTLLYGFKLDLVGRYLRLPSRQPDYRQGRDHTAFLINLPLDAIQLRCRLRDAWQAEVELTAVPRELIDRLVAEKHSRPEWTRRK